MPNATNPTIEKTKSFINGILSRMNALATLNCRKIANNINNKSTIMSTRRSATMLPKPLSNGMPLYFLTMTALEISPDLGTVKLSR